MCPKEPELSTRSLKSSGAAAAAFGQKSNGDAVYRYSNKKVVPLLLFACKTAVAAATFKK